MMLIMDLTRRGFLGAVVAIGLAGCAPMPDPRINAPEPTWSRPPIWYQAAETELALATAYATAAVLFSLMGMHVEGRIEWCEAASKMHADHAAFLTTPDPWRGYRPPPEITTDANLEEPSLTELIAAATENATTALAQAPAGPEALLWASLMACCAVGAAWSTNQVAAPPPPPVYNTVRPSKIVLDSAATAAGPVLDRYYALDYALTTALGRLGGGNSLRAAVESRLVEVKAQQRSLQEMMHAGGVTPPAPALSYELSDGLSGERAIRASWNTLEASLGLPGIYLAGCQSGDEAVETAKWACEKLVRNPRQQITWWPTWPA